MKRLIIAATVVALAGGVSAAELSDLATGAEIVLQAQPKCGHLQDVCFDGKGSLYWAHTRAIYKTDVNGKVLATAEVQGHHAGLEVRNGRLFVAVCPMQGTTGGKTTPECRLTVGEYDAETLAPVRMHVTEINDRAGSLAILEDGTFVVGCLRPQDIAPTQVRLHHLDADFKLIKSHVVDNVPVKLGIEVFKRVGSDLYLVCYGVDADRKPLGFDAVRLDPTFRETGRGKLGGATGLVIDEDCVWTGWTRADKETKAFTSKLVRRPRPDWTRGRTAAKTVEVASPDGRNVISLSDGAGLRIAVARDGKTVLNPTEVGLTLAGKTSGRVFGEVVRRQTPAGKIRTPIYGKDSIPAAAESARVAVGDGFFLELLARDDGVAWRFETAFDGQVEVLSERADVAFAAENTELYAGVVTRLPTENTLWRKPDPLQHCYEQEYVRMTAGEVLVGMAHSLLPLPLTGRTREGVWFCLKDTDVRDYPGWHLGRKSAGATLEAVFAREPDPEDVTVDQRHRWVGRRLDRLVRTAGRRTWPWRCVVLGDTAGGLVESDLLYALATPAEGDFSWVKPGLAAWDWWCGYDLTGVPFRAGRNTETYLAFVDFAAEYGIPYYVVDGGWNEDLDVARVSPAVDLPRVLARAREKGVRIILWSSWASLYGRVEEMFARYAAMGVAGFKIDYFDRDDAVQCRFLEDTARVAAKYRLVIDYHGCQPPNGLQRTYPNVLNFEGVRGLECARWDPASTNLPDHDVRLAFTRFVAGPADYTPGAMLSVSRAAFVPHSDAQVAVTGTRAHQMALYVVYEAPLQMLCDSPVNYAKCPEVIRFLASVPTVWDETRVLSGSPEDGGHALFARRRGEAWYVGALAGWTGADVELDTAFLGKGAWRLESFADGINSDRSPTDFVRRVESCRAGDRRKLTLAPGGGWVGRFVKEPSERPTGVSKGN